MRNGIGRNLFAGAACALALSACGGDPATETLSNDAAAPAAPIQSGGPLVGDHWHSVYGVYGCGDGFLPIFESTSDPDGIHSHQDGVVHVHPFKESVSRERATFAVFLQAMGYAMSATGITDADGNDPFADCAPSDTANQVMLVRRSIDNLDAPPEVWHGSSARTAFFAEDGEVWVLAVVPTGTDPASIPLPPDERFDAFNMSSGRTPTS
ncbi:MAG: hypothetical protein AAGC53_01405 [Actinomycetota bacterium]